MLAREYDRCPRLLCNPRKKCVDAHRIGVYKLGHVAGAEEERAVNPVVAGMKALRRGLRKTASDGLNESIGDNLSESRLSCRGYILAQRPVMRHYDGGKVGCGNIRGSLPHIAVMKREHDIGIRQRRLNQRGVLGVDRKERARVTAAQRGKALESAHDILRRGVKTETQIDDIRAAPDKALRLRD